MRILFDQGVFDLRNMGNVALLQVAVERIARMWPHAALEVLTSAPHVLRLYCPDACPVRPIGPDRSWEGWSHRLGRVLPRPILRVLLEVREAAWNRRSAGGAPRHAIDREGRQAQKSQAGGPDGAPGDFGPGPHESVSRVAGVDLVVATGAQYMSDACRDDALRVLDRLETANRRGIPTAMVGQGVGPFDDAELRRRACAVYPLVDLVFVRDRVAGAQLLGSLGVDPARVVFTGDDAIELAYEERRPSLGNAVGVSLRLAPYTVVAGADVAALAGVLRGKSRGWRVPIVPVPISFSRHELDERALRAIAGRTPWTRRPLGRFRTPREIARSVGRCRLVVTGTFHAGVFALAQGIPVVGLARSRMYEQKFESLADQFGPGCQVVRLDRPAFRDELATAMDSAWRDAEQLRPTLLRTAHELAVLGRDAYGRLRDLVPGRAGG